MEVSRAYKRGKVYYLVSLRPESFAMDLYSLMMSVVVANLMWLQVLYLCSWLQTLDMDYLVDQLSVIHMVFAAATTYTWWRLHQDRGRSLLTHLMFFVWQGSKLMAAALEICSFSGFYDKLLHLGPKYDIRALITRMAFAFTVTAVVECLGFVLAYKYLRVKTPKPTKTLQAPSLTA